MPTPKNTTAESRTFYPILGWESPHEADAGRVSALLQFQSLKNGPTRGIMFSRS